MTEEELHSLGSLKALNSLLTRHNKDLILLLEKNSDSYLKQQIINLQKAIEKHKKRRLSVLNNYRKLQRENFILRQTLSEKKLS